MSLPQLQDDYNINLSRPLPEQQSANQNENVMILSIRIVEQAVGGRQYSKTYLIDRSNQTRDLIKVLNHSKYSTLGKVHKALLVCWDGFLMRKDAVWVVVVSPVSASLLLVPSHGDYPLTLVGQMSMITDVEDQSFGHRVYIKSGERDQVLTKAISDPVEADQLQDFITTHLPAVIHKQPLIIGQASSALCLRHTFHYAAAAMWFAVAFLLSLSMGIAVAVVSGKWNFGVPVGSALFAVLTVVQCILLWQFSSSEI